MTFVGADTGFVLGQAGIPGQCGPPRKYICTSIAGTTDHGGTWHGVKAPVTGAPAGPAGVSQVRFYNTSDGWAFGPQLWATHDGGQHWNQIDTHGLRVTALEAAGQRVFAVWAQCSGTGPDFAADCTSSALYSASPGSDQWAPVPGAGTGYSLSGTAGSAALVLSPSRGYLLAPDGTLLSGPVASAGAWQPVTSTGTGSTSPSPGTASPSPAPCEPGPAQADGQPSGALLTGTTSSRLVLVCTSPATGATQAKQVYTSADNGQQWQKAGTAPAAGTATSVAGTAAGTIVLATTAGLQVSTDGGTSWAAGRGALPSGGFSYVGMTSANAGRRGPGRRLAARRVVHLRRRPELARVPDPLKPKIRRSRNENRPPPVLLSQPAPGRSRNRPPPPGARGAGRRAAHAAPGRTRPGRTRLPSGPRWPGSPPHGRAR